MKRLWKPARTGMLLGLCLSIFVTGSFRILGYAGCFLIILCAIATSRHIRMESIGYSALLCLIVLLFRLLVQVFSNVWYNETADSFISSASIFVYIILIRNSKLEFDDWIWIFSRFMLFILLIGLYLFMTNQITYSRMFSTIFGNFLLIGFGVSWILSQVIDKGLKRNILYCFIGIIFILTFACKMRSSVIAELIGIIFTIYISIKKEGPRFSRIVFVTIILICFIVPYGYLELYSPSTQITAKISIWVQQQVKMLTGSRLFSGRDILWPHILGALENNQLIGNGVGFTPSQIYDTTFSTHNLFLFIRSEQGFLGLFAFIILMYNVWNNYFGQLRNSTKFAAEGFMVAVMIQQTFSLGLLGGKGAFFIICWTLLIAMTKREGQKDGSQKYNRTVHGME